MLNKIWKLILILSLTVASAFTFTGCGTKSINLNDYLTYSISGYDGYGNAIVDFDLESFTLEASSLYIGKKLNSMNDVYDLPEKKQTAVLQLNSDIYDMYYEDYIFDGSFDKNSHLSNGDVVTYKWVGAMDPSLLSDLKEKYKLEIVCSDFTEKVSDLQEVEYFDPFETLELTYSGTSPDGKVSISNPDYISIPFNADKYSGLSNGDSITVSIPESSFENILWAYGGLPSETSKTYTVDGLDAYMTSLSQLPSETDELIRKELDDFVISWDAQYEASTITNYDVLGYYLLVSKDQSSWNWGNKNMLYIVYRADIHYEKEDYYSGEVTLQEDVQAYKYLRFDNAIVYGDGTAYIDILDYSYPNSWSGEDFTSESGVKYAGYKSLDTLYNNIVAAKVADYTYDSTVSR